MHGAIPPFPNMHSWRGAPLKNTRRTLILLLLGDENAYKISVRRTGGNRSLRKPSHRWENINTALKHISIKVLSVFTRLQWRALVNPVMNLQVP
jgi:hypothetical protein